MSNQPAGPVWDPRIPDEKDFYTQNPDRARAIFEIRKRLAAEMDDMVRNPAKYNNADVLDALRDKCKRYGLQFLVKPEKNRPNLLHVFVRDPIIEPLVFTAAATNPIWLGWVEKNTEPTGPAT
jgi:hypothetical protein